MSEEIGKWYADKRREAQVLSVRLGLAVAKLKAAEHVCEECRAEVKRLEKALEEARNTGD
jgi:hypothetical protein